MARPINLVLSTTQKDKKAKQTIDDHVANFFYENGIIV